MTKKGPPPKEAPEKREARLAEALRANLRKRKEQQRARAAAPVSVWPVLPEEFAALMEPFNVKAQHIAVAVSGGPDSMALAWCLKRWAEAQGRNVTGLIVDHQLRPESGDEAATVKDRLAALGIEAEVLRWDHEAVTSRVHVRARKARYDLLIAACKRHGIPDLLLAHQREDQAETILMRFAKGSGIDGLAGMMPASTMQDIRVLRPLLGVPKERLIATCVAAGIATVSDPGNEKERYARGRLRKVMPLLAQEGLTIDRLVDLGARAQEIREAMDDAARILMRVAVRMDMAGVIEANLEQLRSAPRAIALRVLSACMQSVHKTDYPPERASLLPVLEALCADGPMGARTLHGCVIGKGDKTATLIREYEAISDSSPIAPGETVVWDGRWEVRLEREAGIASMAKPGLTVRALGVLPHDELERLAPGLRRLVPKGRARAVLPAIWQGETRVLVPDLTGASGTPAQAKTIHGPETLFIPGGHCI